MKKYLIAGLGNIGKEYNGTRHNIGFEVLDAFAEKHGFEWRLDRLAFVAEGTLKGRTLYLIKPTTYMNLSGKALSYWLNKSSVPIEQSMVVTDDLSLDLGKLRSRAKGSDGGHNGLKSIQESLGTQHYPRMRFGIGSNFSRGRQIDFVLGQWRKEEITEVELTINRAVDALECFILRDLQTVMNEFNG